MNAALYAIGSMTAAQFHQLRRELGMQFVHTASGNYRIESSPTADLTGPVRVLPSPAGTAVVAGPEPEAA